MKLKEKNDKLLLVGSLRFTK